MERTKSLLIAIGFIVFCIVIYAIAENFFVYLAIMVGLFLVIAITLDLKNKNEEKENLYLRYNTKNLF